MFTVGQHIRLDILDHRDLTYQVGGIERYERHIGRQAFFFTDYLLSSEGSPVKRLRLGDGFCLLLSLFDEIPFDVGFQRVVDDSQGLDFFNIDDEGKKFYRFDGLEDPYVNVPVIDAITGGFLRTVSYWDYAHDGKDEAGQPLREVLMIECDENTGRFQLWRGFEIDQHNIW